MRHSCGTAYVQHSAYCRANAVDSSGSDSRSCANAGGDSGAHESGDPGSYKSGYARSHAHAYPGAGRDGSSSVDIHGHDYSAVGCR